MVVLFNGDWPVKADRLTPTKRPRSYHHQEPIKRDLRVYMFCDSFFVLCAFACNSFIQRPVCEAMSRRQFALLLCTRSNDQGSNRCTISLCGTAWKGNVWLRTYARSFADAAGPVAMYVRIEPREAFVSSPPCILRRQTARVMLMRFDHTGKADCGCREFAGEMQCCQGDATSAQTSSDTSQTRSASLE